jgi:hypothetical protein
VGFIVIVHVSWNCDGDGPLRPDRNGAVECGMGDGGGNDDVPEASVSKYPQFSAVVDRDVDV